ncbi:hypothetical protein [Spirosoma fluviale]|nr:hypothetical protein [Spirosoma fluviale]
MVDATGFAWWSINYSQASSFSTRPLSEGGLAELFLTRFTGDN